MGKNSGWIWLGVGLVLLVGSQILSWYGDDLKRERTELRETLIAKQARFDAYMEMKKALDSIKRIEEVKADTIHLVRATRYNPEASQCDSDPLTTADNSRIDVSKLNKGTLRWCALSRDLLDRWGGPVNYGDVITVHSEDRPWLNGEWEVHDTMNSRYSKTIDFLQPRGAKPKLGIGKDFKIVKINGKFIQLD